MNKAVKENLEMQGTAFDHARHQLLRALVQIEEWTCDNNSVQIQELEAKADQLERDLDDEKFGLEQSKILKIDTQNELGNCLFREEKAKEELSYFQAL